MSSSDRVRAGVLLLTVAVGAPLAAQNQQPPAAPPVNPNPPSQVAPVGRRASPPQPQQKQGVEYFAGTWTFSWTGRESAITQGPRTGTATYTRQGTTNVVNLSIDGKNDLGAAYKESGTLEWNEATKSFAVKERLGDGTAIQGNADWSSPLSVQFESQPVQVKGQTLRLRRTYSILSAVAFSVMEEIQTNGGAYQRLGQGQYTRK